jgi:signal transduction histidine kinase/ActR/RegA family two-component response regulator
VATTSNARIGWKPQPGALVGELIALDSLPFAAALLDHSGGVVAANPRWYGDHCEESYRSPAIDRGIRSILSSTSTQFTEDYEQGGNRYRLFVTPCQAGALAIHQALDSSRTTQSEKMETVGRLVGGVAHDFANLLTLIGGYSEILLSRVREEDPLRAELDEIRKAAGRGSRLTGQLLGFTRGQSVQPRVLDLNAIIVDLKHMLVPAIGEHVTVETVLCPGLYRLLADPGQMEQVIMNLVLNARDAMPRGGKIVIETANHELDDGTARAHEMEPGRAVLVSISDTGEGIEPAILERVWEPFFTTKKEGMGTGLGLTTVRRIIKENRGAVWVSSDPGMGSVFTVCLPCAHQVPELSDGAAPVQRALAGSETLLLVEDEEGVRRLLVHVLERGGYQVLEAANGEQALGIFEKQCAGIDLVLTDMVMPKMGGRELAERVCQIRPYTKVIFMSGYTDDVLVRTGALNPGMSFLQKPLRAETLTAKIREALDAAALPLSCG